ncbi:MAG: carboxypeptidase regulatory-like domain-containing protein [Candidatus Cloacimonas sp.]
MKRLSLLLVMICMVCLSWATIDEYYTFNATTGTYTPITGTDAAISTDDGISAAIPIGFTFGYGDFSYSEVKISSNGWVGLGTSQTGSNLTNNLASTSYQPVVAPLWDDLSMASGIVSYLTTGTAPNRIFTVQYADAKWNYSGPVGFNFQVQLYETGKVSFIYGSNAGTPNNPSASIGINMTPGGSGWFYSINPTSGAASTTTETTTITTFPAQGTVYEFNPVVAQANDLAATAISGNTTPTAGTATAYTITVRNRGTNPQSNYQVKLIDSNNNELGSTAGTTIQSNETLTFQVSWTPTVAGALVIRGKVVLTGDQNPTNDLTPTLNITVQPAGVQAVTIANGTETMRIPMDFFWKNSLSESIYLSDELGFVSGTITSLAYYNNFLDSPANGATKIWMGSTNVQDLSGGWIPSTQLSLVFDGNITYPSGVNTITIPLQTPYMHTPGNLVIMVQRPMDTQYYSASDNFYGLTIGANRTINIYSDSTPYDPANPPTGATLTGLVPKTTIFYSGQAIVNDMGCLSITGNPTPSVGAASNYVVTVKNNGTAVQTNYTVKLMKEGGVEVGSVAGTSINSLQTLQFTIPWTPTQTGATYIYGEVVLATDEIATNNQSAHLSVNVQAQGVVAITVGAGGSTGRMPVDMYYHNSLFETIYLATELNIGGLLTGIQFYNNFATNLPNMPTNIWVGETTQTDLSTGWIPSTQLTQVYNGTVNYPSGPNNILITLNPPYAYGGGNLVVMVERPMDTQYYSSSDVFVTQTGTVAARTLNLYSDSVDYDPASPAAATPAAMFPKTTFMLITEGMGSISGTVSVGATPLSGASVTVAGTALVCTTVNGAYNFPYVMEGAHQVTATKHGYNSVTNNVTVVEDQNTVSNFTLAPLPQVTVSGRVVGSDNPTAGLANATIALSGYEPYEAVTNASGNFSIPNVYASQTYNYTVTMTGYQQATGQVVVGTTNVNMGDITVTELTLPPVNVQATDNGAIASITWMEPGSGGGDWLHYDNGENNDSIGTGGANDFDVYIRFPASELTQYAGMSLYTLKVWPAQAGTFSVRVWTGGTATQPANMVVDQAFTPTLDTYNTVNLNNPVLVNGNEELWFGYRNVVTGGYPAGCDAGPAVDGFGNMMYFGGQWTTLIAQNPALDYNWNIQGFVGWAAPTNAPSLEGIKTVLKDTKSLPTANIKSVAQNTKSTQTVRSTNERIPVGYQVWRLLQGQETNESAWTLLTPTPINALMYPDAGWISLPDGTYKWAVKTVYTGGVYSIAGISNPLPLYNEIGTIAGIVRNMQNQPISGATVTCENVTATTNATGAYSMTVLAGTHTVTATHPNYQSVSQTGVIVVTGETTTVNFQLPPTANIFTDDFESYADFTITFAPWTLVDVDQSGTYGIQGYSWENIYNPQAFIIFNPTTTSPALTTFAAHGGNKLAACFASTTPPNNDWMITPQLTHPNSVKFWARSYVSDYGLERFKVGISPSTNPADFTIISGPNYIEAPVDWTEFTYQITNVGNYYIGIQCLSNDAFIFCVDDVTVTGGDVNDPEVPVVATALHNNYPNPFNPETTISYSVKEAGPVTLQVYNVKGQLVKTLIKGIQEPGNHTIVWNGTDNNGRSVSSGVYYYKMQAGKYSSTKKMIMMK